MHKSNHAQLANMNLERNYKLRKNYRINRVTGAILWLIKREMKIYKKLIRKKLH